MDILFDAPNIDQNAWGAINGCEAASLLEGLHYQNKLTEVNYGEFLKMMPIDQSGNPYRGFGGSPYRNQSGKFEAIFVKPLSDWAAQYTTFRDISDLGIEAIYDSIRKGEPVVAYVTVHFEEPEIQRYPFGDVAINNHAVLVDGLTDSQVHVSDPIDGSYFLDKEKFAHIQQSRKMALSLLK
ncbi:C39 family peptidase [Lentilactobacillus sp. SPB1-3]|uniref:C39 family peptidase n=1 Tax=Lentilactobacillus terminaliae TaxID=3003483 RepID=A0ACD5DHD0_9LACO|nr:C39 family peptidase [Lentilactobacillus sp. SPB1-3]MCZ0977028.1 C39 family peptidase [Lentilactobacillus sp. SPB1-3]